jgi:hypothetical protein
LEADESLKIDQSIASLVDAEASEARLIDTGLKWFVVTER